MIRTVKQGNFHVNNREARQHTIRQCLAQTFFNSGNKFTRNRTTLDRIDEFETLTSLIRLHLKPYVTVLTLTAGLLDEFTFNFNRLPDRFTICNLRRADVSFNAEFATHPVNQNLKVQFTHTGNDGLTGFFICAHSE
ncbi:hypothetical protein GALL_549450 [mine drainage metagenome]|uniref:Uncharacterized protein n=1 Tax=mine drainage metagenome TaxID=410659 RepID=A0A1J5NWB5_9ZZZZ